MASPGKNSENLNILEEIYHEDKDKIQPRKSFKEYFQDSQRIDKLLSGAIIFFGLVAIILGFFQFRSNLTRGFFTPAESDQTASVNEDDLLGLSQKDTDSDGLSDYDELYVYGSSPYLKDSDSDGIDDQKEVALGTDPNCPKGQNCFANWGTPTAGGATSPSSPSLLLKGGQTNVGATQLRQIFKEAGLTDEELNQFSDEELLALTQQLLSQAEAGSGQPVPASQAASAGLVTKEQIKNLPPAEIRQLLLQAGASKEMLDKVSDEELLKLVGETLAGE